MNPYITSKLNRFVFTIALLSGVSSLASAQSFPQPQYWKQIFDRFPAPAALAVPQNLSDHVVDRRLRIALEDAIRLAMINNTELHVDRLTYEMSRYPIMAAHGAFDPVITSSFAPQRSTSPSFTSLAGAQTLSTLTQQSNVSFNQTLQTGTSYGVSFSSNKNSTNSIFNFLNPSLSSTLTFTVTQPLLRNRSFLANQAPILLARRARTISEANFKAQAITVIANTITQYWSVVQASENLQVLQKSLELAEASYKQSKRALELGALPPLDIYRSESQVAQRRVAVIQGQTQLVQLEDQLKQLIGADLDPTVQSLALELTDRVDNPPLEPVDLNQAIQTAIANRPELIAVREQIGSDKISVQVARQNLKPDLNLTAFYSGNGVGGDLVDGTGAVMSRGGFGDSWGQLTSFRYPTYGMNLQLHLPLRNSQAEANLGTAVASQRRNFYALRQQQQAVTLQVRNAVHQLEGNRLAIDAAKSALELAQKNLAAEQRKYELGAQTIFFVLDAQSQLAMAEQSLVQAKISYENALTTLFGATGELLDRHHVQISDFKQ
jgi:outer membrane protein